jgi:biopolymer transport protein ExbB
MHFLDTVAALAIQQQVPGSGNNVSNAQALQGVSLNTFIHEMSGFDYFIGAVIILMSAASWYYIIANFIRNMLLRSREDRVVQAFWDADSPRDAIAAMERQPRGEPFSKIALDCAEAASHHQQSDAGALAESLDRSEFIDRALRRSVARESLRLEAGLTVLASVGSAAVFVGLLGTVIGIVHALTAIGASGEASIQAVAGPVGEALYMTAGGLAAAIPAVLAYNFYVRSNRITFARFDDFAHDLHDYFATGARIGEEVPAE